MHPAHELCPQFSLVFGARLVEYTSKHNVHSSSAFTEAPGSRVSLMSSEASTQILTFNVVRWPLPGAIERRDRTAATPRGPFELEALARACGPDD